MPQCIYYFMRILHGRRPAVLASGVLMTVPLFFYMSRQAKPDMMLTLTLCTVMGFFALARFGPSEKRTRYFMLFYASAGLGFLTKGPVSSAIIVLAVGLFWAMHIRPFELREWKKIPSALRAFVKEYRLISGAAVFLLVAAPWYCMEIMRHGNDYVSTFFGWETMDRFNQTIRGHDGPVSFYVRTIWHGTHPWCGLFVAGIFFYAGRFRDPDPEARLRWLYLAWALATLVLFTWAGTKISHYILTIVPAFAVVVGLVWDGYFAKERSPWMGPVILMAIIIGILPIRDFIMQETKFVFDAFTSKRTIYRMDVLPFLRGLCVAWVLVLLPALFWRRSWTLTLLMFGVTYANGVYFLHHVVPEHAHRRTLSFYLEDYIDQREPHSDLILYGSEFRQSM
ncbi:MAG: glycosyltransferase family 39 protein, partial [Verrucomicrobiota bacterium]